MRQICALQQKRQVPCGLPAWTEAQFGLFLRAVQHTIVCFTPL